MPSEAPDSVNPCPITPASEILLAKWTTQVLWALIHDGRLRFSELRQHVQEVTPKVLTQRLRRMERDGLVVRICDPGAPVRVRYEATPLAMSLEPVFAALEHWSEDHAAEIAAARAAYTGPLPA